MNSTTPKLHVLAVDDDEHFCEFLIRIFSVLDSAELTVVRSGDAAQLRLQNEPFDLVLLDLHMPPPDGHAVLKYIRATRPDLPVLVLSGIEQAGPIILGDRYTVFAEKPTTLPALEQLVSEYVNRCRTKPETDTAFLRKTQLTAHPQPRPPIERDRLAE